MSEPTKKPIYISSSPSGEDLFEGKSHEKISNTIFELIKNKALPNNVIGIEGKWGSGKSNVVSILNNKFGEIKSDYFFFTYDAWGHQEDLTRRTFLEELITSLKFEKKFKGSVDWTNELNKLLAKKSTKNTTKFPKIKFYWILIMASILLFSFFNVLYDDFLLKNDLFPKHTLPNLKLFLSKYLLPIIVFVWGLIELRKEYKAFDKKDQTKDYDYKERLKRLLYIFSGSDLESEELEHTLENEPTVKSFKEYFENITSDLKSDGLVIVFDNMDRLTKSDKVLSLWSSIHTFFAEEKVDNVWVIIPYDKGHLAKHFDDDNHNKVDNFIGKTFSTIFRISPPVLSDWKKFFELKFKEAFDDIINDNDIELISSLYELITDVNNKRPRDIITFINNLVSLYLQHNSTIDIKYLALFLLRKKEILENPLISIANKHFLKEESHMFRNEAELEENLAAIVYNVDKEKSSEVLLTNNIDDIFLKANIEALKEVKKHSEFKVYFANTVNKSNFSNSRPENTAKIFDEVKDVISAQALKSYWERFANNLDRRPKEEFIELLEWHKSIIKNTSRKTSKSLADKIVYNSKSEFEKSSNSSKYYSTLHDLLVFLNNENKKLKPLIEKVRFTPKDFVHYIDDMSNVFKEGECTFDDLKIFTDSDELNKYFIDHENGFVEELHKFVHVIRYLKTNAKSYKFKNIQDKVDSELNSIAYTDAKKISKLIEINKVLNEKASLKLIPEAIGTNYLNHHGTNTDEPFIDIISNQIAHLMTVAPRSTVLTNELNKLDNARKIAEVIQYYISYGDLLKVVIEKGRNYPLVDEIIKILTTDYFGFTQSLNSKWVFENLDKIRTKFFEENFTLFLTQFDRWDDKFDIKDIPEVFELRQDILKETFDNNNHEFSSIKLIHSQILSEFREASKEDWLNNFNTESNFNFAFIGLVNSNLLDKKITKSKDFMEAYDEYLTSIAKNEESIPANEEFWNNLLNANYLDKRKLNRIYDDLLDLLIDYPELNVEQIKFFALGIFEFSAIPPTKADSVCRKIILHLNDDDKIFYQILEAHGEKIIQIINSSQGRYNQDLSEMFGQKLDDESIDKALIESIFDKTKLEIPIKDSQDNGEVTTS
ncbi:KAP family P-loop domain-containing protein [Zhouia amylolytica]|uniref:KAP family P-loop domain-containing protein n=1 Tax=Zhouia amylolytica TaxID=376730 RepID=A0A1I6ULP7_9FLAO|nr:P-loop NTPase fold protein [Zhouia amylolytica]SFT02360.1 KAP family P-loop domain-containing protein [Zhouia amylolytica]